MSNDTVAMEKGHASSGSGAEPSPYRPRDRQKVKWKGNSGWIQKSRI